MHMSQLRIKRTFAMAAIALMGSLGYVSGSAGAVVGNTVYVSTTGTDAPNTCSTPSTACATINYAISVAVPGDSVSVAAGSYHQTVDVNKAVRVVGSGAGRTTIDGSGLDPVPLYGVVYVGPTGGASSVSGFTITNAADFAETGGEPEVVALADSNPSDSVVISSNIISLGSDPTSGTDFPIGIDTFNNAATTTIFHNNISGTFQGALLEDNGPVAFTHNRVVGLISNTYTDTSGVTPNVETYPGEGLFFLSDESGSLTGQNATNNNFADYAGYGIIMEAGYNSGNCTATPCNGSIAGTISHNHLALGGASETTTGPPATSKPAVGIELKAEFNGNNLTVDMSNNRGFVHSPSLATLQQATNGATTTVTGSGNRIRVRP